MFYLNNNMEFVVIYNIIQYSLLIMLVVCTAIIIKDRFLKDVTIFDRLFYPQNHIEKINCFIETTNEENDNKPALALSIIFPIQNDEQNLPIILENLINSLQKRENQNPEFSWEIVIVNNCSTDNSSNIILGYSHTNDNIKLIRLENELGLSGALQVGTYYCHGKLLLLTDLQTLSINIDKIDNFDQIETMFKQSYQNQTGNKRKQLFSLICGNRKQFHEGNENKKGIPFWVSSFNGFFKSFAGCTGTNSVLDPLCPFVIMTNYAARVIIPNMHINNFCGFADIVSIAQQKNFDINQIDINFNQKAIKPMTFDDFLTAVGEILKLSFCYKLKLWTIQNKGQKLKKTEDV